VGARLIYAKVIDREQFVMKGGEIHPGLENRVVLREEPGEAAAFLVLRAWSENHGTFTETWTIEGVGGGVIYESVPREVHLPTETHVERLEDEVVDLKFDYASPDYTVVFRLDEIEVARATFPVMVSGDTET
jgi:hypothetical protein